MGYYHPISNIQTGKVQAMQKNVMEYLEHTVNRVPDKLAYANEEMGISFREAYDQARAIGSFLYRVGFFREPVVVFMGRHPRTIVTYFGVIYAGCFYVPIDEEMPKLRIEMIFQSLQPRVVLCDQNTIQRLKDYSYDGRVYCYEEMIEEPTNQEILDLVRDKQIDTDPIYIVYTSGSTGMPKGVVACHRSVIDYIDHLSEVLHVGEHTIFGNQTPLYVDACLKELYPTLKFGATAYLIPKSLFLFPLKLIDYLNEYKINTICWVVSALTMLSAFGAFEKEIPKYLHTIAFGSEVFPIKQFRIWREHFSEARFINLYGPTEATGMSCYYEVNRAFDLGDVIPIGRPFPNTEILLIDEMNRPVKVGEEGEICIRGTALTLGYYRDFDKTKEVFVQNPLNSAYPELIYRTGDIGRYNENGELVFVSRKDNQIKHMGHRIELGELEAAAHSLKEVISACALFDPEKKKIILYYVGEISVAKLVAGLKDKLPRYMLPNVIEALPTMPLTINGKINRMQLLENYQKRYEMVR
jgi:D-alanine--poly(phosphoribitol) ligase subunit 1